MQRNLLIKAKEHIQRNRKHRIWQKVVRVMACCVVFCTTYALIMPAITMEQEAFCGCIEHTHSEECYVKTSDFDSKKLICSLEEQEAHVHDSDCYAIPETTAESHTHSEDCYTTEQVLTCTIAESEDHVHTDACYTSEETLICGLEETPVPEPELICTKPVSEGHVHGDECFETVEEPLTCRLEENEEHTHSALCYGTWELVCSLKEHTHELACFSDPEADVETAKVWEKTFKDVELTGVWADDVLAIAKTQIGYKESTRNYNVWEDDTLHGYTRYGDWYGSPYADWCAMFVSFCTHYAEVDGMPLNSSCRAWIEELSQEDVDLYREAGEYEPKPGDLIFFDWKDDNGDLDHLADHVGLVAEVIPATKTQPAMIKTIEGNSADQVKYNTYDADDTEILGYGIMPENPDPHAGEETTLYTYSDDNVQVEVQLPKDTTVPADAELKVTPIESTDDGYDAYVEQAEEAVDGSVANIALYDISFYTADGTYYPVDDTAKVTMHFADAVVDTTADVQVLHYDDNDKNPVLLEEVTVSEEETEAKRNILTFFTGEKTEVQTVVEFKTEGFSTFAVIELTSMYQTVDTITGLDGRSFIIAGVNNWNGTNGDGTPNTLPVMISEAVGNNLQKRLTTSFEFIDNKVTSVALTDYTNAVWTFEAAGTGTYYIKSSQGQYLSIPAKQQLTLSDNKQEFRVVAATGLNANNGNVMNAVCIQAVNTEYYVDLAGNDATTPAAGEGGRPFTSYDETTDNPGHHLALVEYVEPQPIDLSDLADKSYIIVGVNNYNDPNAAVTKNLPVLTGVPGTYTFDNGKGRTVDVLNGNKQTTEGAVYVSNHVMAVALADTANAVWTFEKAEGYDNAYYIKNTTTNTYLHFNGENLTLSGQPQAIEALKAGGFDPGDDQNAIYLRTADPIDGNYYYVNLVGNGNTTCFFGYNPNGADDRGNCLALIEYKEEVETSVIPDDLVYNLDGKNLVITQIGGYAITGTALNTDNGEPNDDRLKAAAVKEVAADKSTVTVSSSDAGLVWEFRAAGTPGQYYIKHVATGKYLHIYDEGKDNDRPLTLEDAPQAIEVLSANDNINPDAVWIRCPKAGMYVDENGNGIYGGNSYDYNAIDLYGGKVDNGFGVWNKSQGGLPDTDKFLLSEYTDLPVIDAVVPPTDASENNLNGKTMVITVPTSNVVMTNVFKDDNGNSKLKAQAAEEKNGIVGVSSDTKLEDVSWTFTSVPNGLANQYYIQDSTGKYLNMNGIDVTLSDTAQPITVYDSGNGTGTVVFCVTDSDGHEYLLDMSARANAFGAWARAHGTPDDNNRLKLTPVEEFDENSEVVTNLDGKTLALVGIHDGNSGTKRMALTSDTKTGNNYLQGVEVNLSGTTGKAYTFDDTKFTNNNELWTFEAVDNKLGVYYIKAANGQYLNLGDGTATVSGNAQEITVLSDTVVGGDGITYEVVYLRATVDGKEVYLRREWNGNDTGFYGDVTGNITGFPERRIVLAQPCTINIDVEKGLNLETDDWLYKPQFTDGLTKKEVPVVEGGTLPTSGELGAEPVDNTLNGTTGIQHFVSFCFNESMDPYTAGKGRDFPQAYMASWAPELDVNKNGYIDPAERGDTNGDGKVNDSDDPAARAKFIETLREHVYDPDFKGESPYWGVEYELTHYEVTLPDGSTLKDDSGNNARFLPGASYVVNGDGTITIEDVNGKAYKVPSGSTFKAQYREFSDILTFYINLYGVVADVAADIQPRYIEDFTLGLAIAHIYNPGQYAGDTTEDYTKTNEFINSLFKGAYGENVDHGVMHAVIDGFITRDDPENRGTALNDPNKHRILSNEMQPALGASATALAAHVLDYIRTVPDIDIMLKNYVAGNGENTPTLNPSTIDTATFDVRWYVVKDQGDSWHIDGVTIGKTEPIAVTKYFYGLEDADVSSRVNYERTDININGEFDYSETNNYQIGVSIADENGKYNSYYNMQPYDQNDMDKDFTYGDNKTCKDPNLNPAIDNLYTYNGGSNPYNWTMSAILNQSYKLTEENYDFKYTDGNGDLQAYDRWSTVTVTNKDGTSRTYDGISAAVIGGETASVVFNNYYTKPDTGMFVVKKLSSVTDLPLAGAKFTLYDSNGKALYTETTDADGEASFYNLEVGNYILKETGVPDGFESTNTDGWPISVFKDSNTNETIRVMSGRQGLYPIDSADGSITFAPLAIRNEPAKDTMKVVKQFVGISRDQVATLAENYEIEMKPKEDGNSTYTLKLGKYNGITPVVSADGLTYTWTLTNVPEIEYTVTESQFKLPNYVTHVSVEGFVDGTYTTQVTDPVVANNTATFTATFDQDHEDGFTIYNSYANDFSMQITKVDGVDQKPLSGATFEVYGDHFIATDPKNVVVGGQTLYYLGTVITGKDGMATFDGWTDDDGVFHKLVLGYSYALVETKAPDGYNKLKDPIYLGVVNAEGVTDLDKDPNLVFSNGVYYITVENQPGYELPKAGGTGTYQYIVGGLLLLAAAAILLYNHTKRGKEEHASF